MPALDLMVLLASHPRVPTSLERQTPVVHVDVNLVTSDTRKLGRQQERFSGFTEIDGRHPSLRARGRQSLEPVLDGEQIAKRIPARERHVWHRSTIGRDVALC